MQVEIPPSLGRHCSTAVSVCEPGWGLLPLLGWGGRSRQGQSDRKSKGLSRRGRPKHSQTRRCRQSAPGLVNMARAEVRKSTKRQEALKKAFSQWCTPLGIYPLMILFLEHLWDLRSNLFVRLPPLPEAEGAIRCEAWPSYRSTCRAARLRSFLYVCHSSIDSAARSRSPSVAGYTLRLSIS